MADIRTTETTEEKVVNEELQERKADHSMLVVKRVINLFGFIVFTLLALRFLLTLLGANPSNGFADFIYSVSYPFVAPFFGLFSYTPELGAARFEFETIVAAVVYLIVFGILAR